MSDELAHLDTERKHTLKTLNSFLVISLLLTACTTTSDVVSTGGGTYLVSSHGIAGNGSGGAQLVSATQTAGAYSQTLGKQLNIVKSSQIEPMFGRAPSGQLEFRCE